MKSFSQYLKEARESLERRWNDITRAMGQIPSTTNPMGPFNQYELDVNLGGDFPVKVKPFALSPVAGPAGDFEYNTARRGGTVRLDPASSVQGSPTLWHELAHGTQARSFDTAMFDLKTRQPKMLTANPTAKGGIDFYKAIAASRQAAVPYHAKTREMDARAFEYGKISANAGRSAAESMLRELRALAREHGALPPTTDALKQIDAYRRRVAQASATQEKGRIQAAAQTPTDTPMPTAFGGTRPPSEGEVKIRSAVARKGEQLAKRGMQNVADMVNLGFEQTASPAIIKSIVRHVKSRTGVEQYSTKEWDAVSKMLAAMSAPPSGAASKAANTGALPAESTPKPTDITTRSFSVSPRKPTGLRGLGLPGLGGILGAGADAGASVAGVYSTPEPHTRMQGEKMYGTDIGLAFNVDDQGELMADPAGMEAARRRRKEGRSFPTWYPER